jgi:hypothetical protein
MYLATISIIRDEEDIIEDFVRHHAPLAERMYITLHRSHDGTADILERLKEEGLPLAVSRDETPHYAQAEILNRLMHTAAQDGAQRILVLDADEFLVSDEPDMRDALEHTDPRIVTTIPWRTYVPHPSDDPAETSPVRRMRHRRDVERPAYHKLLIPGVIAPYGELPMGSHQLLQRSTGLPFPWVASPSLFLAHFPIRTEAQLRRKILQGWEAHSANPQRKPGQNFHWESLVERCRDVRPIGREELLGLALRYAMTEEGPITPIHDPIRHKAL